jgi:hypothetical protein
VIGVNAFSVTRPRFDWIYVHFSDNCVNSLICARILHLRSAFSMLPSLSIARRNAARMRTMLLTPSPSMSAWERITSRARSRRGWSPRKVEAMSRPTCKQTRTFLAPCLTKVIEKHKMLSLATLFVNGF